ncbi:MAG TPA: hypothetical protein VHC90_04370 [Bryobacteraceae bacterium]|nr:hypothetical protein [Bryobacteraceae bacterium]
MPRLRLPAICAAIAVAALLTGALYRLWPRTIHPAIPDSPLLDSLSGGRQRITIPGRTLVGFVGPFDNELFAWLMFDFARTERALAGSEVMLIVNDDDISSYSLALKCPDNLPDCVDEIARLRARGIGGTLSWAFLTRTTVNHFEEETRIFIRAYSGPAQNAFHHLSTKKRAAYVSHFLRFKAATDKRVLGDATVRSLSPEKATQLAADIITVADFYDLPLSSFLGIGAMENNYLDVNGDLQHKVWKKRADSGDVVVRRASRGVLVENPALGVWQITRETLRYAHSLFLKDRRDYSQLPQRLRPPRALQIDNTSSGVLTTYAGLLLRHLLDYFHGDLSLAIGAYNGGPGNPNQEYETGVRNVAEYAHRILDRAAALHGDDAEMATDRGISLTSCANAHGCA